MDPKDELIYDTSIGYSSIEHKIKNNFDTKYKIGSVSKQFTATAILLLEERGLLSTKDKISMYYPGIEIFEPNMTIHHLLTHTSGISEINMEIEYKKTFEKNDCNNYKVIKEALQEKTLFILGEESRYSNYGYLILSQIIEKVSKVEFSSFLNENIFKKLGMLNSGVDKDKLIVENLSKAYDVYGDDFINARYINMDIFVGSGNLYSTVNDLYLWSNAMDNESILSKESIKKMNTIYSEILSNGYGYGVMITKDSNNDEVIFHWGILNGGNSYLIRNINKNIVIVLLFNKQVLAVSKLAWRIYKLAIGKEVELPIKKVKYKLNGKEIDKFFGVYVVNNTMKVEVKEKNGRFSFLFNDYDMYYGYPISDRVFQIDKEESLIPFSFDEKGETVLFGAKRTRFK